MKIFGFSKSLMVGFMLLIGASSVSAQDSNIYFWCRKPCGRRCRRWY